LGLGDFVILICFVWASLSIIHGSNNHKCWVREGKGQNCWLAAGWIMNNNNNWILEQQRCKRKQK
jgi:drug/metabolite transporter superfamily protein YnfA